MPHVEALRNAIERERNQRLMDCFGFFGVLQGSLINSFPTPSARTRAAPSGH